MRYELPASRCPNWLRRAGLWSAWLLPLLIGTATSATHAQTGASAYATMRHALAAVRSYQASVTFTLGSGPGQTPTQTLLYTIVAVRSQGTLRMDMITRARMPSSATPAILGETVVEGARYCERVVLHGAFTCHVSASAAQNKAAFESNAFFATLTLPLKAVGSAAINGQSCAAYALAKNMPGTTLRLYIAGATHLPCSLTLAAPASNTAQGAISHLSMTWSHFDDPKLSVPHV